MYPANPLQDFFFSSYYVSESTIKHSSKLTMLETLNFPFSFYFVFCASTLIRSTGRPMLMRPTMFLGGSIGALFGLFLGYQTSFARLTGYEENAVEVAKYAPKQTSPTSSQLSNA